MRNPTLAPQLEKTYKTPQSSGDEGLHFLHCLAGSIPGSERSPGERIGYPLHSSWASLVAQMVKNLPAMRETWVQSLVWATRVSWSPLSGLKGVQPPLPFGERTRDSNPGLLHCRWILYCLSHQGSPRILEGVAYPFSRGGGGLGPSPVRLG